MKFVLPRLIMLLSGVADPRTVQDAPVTIAYEEVGPWETFRLAWHIDASGAGSYERSGTTPGGDDRGAVQLDLTEFARLDDLLRPLDGAPQLACPDAFTDQGVRVLSWTRNGQITTFVLDRGCESKDASAIAARMEQANGIVRAAREQP